jgi:hypothetical protein
MAHDTGRMGRTRTFRAIESGLLESTHEGRGLTVDDVVRVMTEDYIEGDCEDPEESNRGPMDGPVDITIYEGDAVVAIARHFYDGKGGYRVLKIGEDFPLLQPVPDELAEGPAPEYLAEFVIRDDSGPQLESVIRIPDRDDDDDQAEPDEEEDDEEDEDDATTDDQVVTIMFTREQAVTLFEACRRFRRAFDHHEDLTGDQVEDRISAETRNLVDAALEVEIARAIKHGDVICETVIAAAHSNKVDVTRYR